MLSILLGPLIIAASTVRHTWVRTRIAIFPFYTAHLQLASPSLVIWQGYMGNQKPALLFREGINLDPKGDPRKEQLSTGVYTLVLSMIHLI